MMFKRIFLITSLMVFLLGTNAFANSKNETPASNHTQSMAIKAESEKHTSAIGLKRAEPTINDFVVPATVGVFIIILFGGYWFVLRKKIYQGRER